MPKRKLTETQVRAIRAGYDGQRGSISKLALRHNVGWNAIYDIVTGKSWKHLLPDGAR